MDLAIAQQGYSVLNFSNWVLFPENYVDNYPGGSSTIGKSAIVWVYPILSKAFGIDTFQLLHLMISLEILTVIFATYIFVRTFITEQSLPAFIALIILIVASYARVMDLARNAQPFYIGQFYAFADVFRILAFCAFFTHRYWLSLLLLCIGFTVHPTITLAILPAMLGFVLIDRARFKELELWPDGCGIRRFCSRLVHRVRRCSTPYG